MPCQYRIVCIHLWSQTLYGNSPNVIENIHLLCIVLLVISVAEEVQVCKCVYVHYVSAAYYCMSKQLQIKEFLQERTTCINI